MPQQPPANLDRITGITAVELLTYAQTYLEYDELNPPTSYFNPVRFLDYAVSVNINGTTGPTLWLENDGPITTLVWENSESSDNVTADTISHTTHIRLTRHMGDHTYTTSFRDKDIISALTRLFFFNTQAPYNQGM